MSSADVDPGREPLLLLRDLVEHLRSVAVEPAQLLERIRLRVERRVGALGELDELQRHRAVLLGGLGEGVVELVLDLEGLLRRRLGVGERGAEVPDLVVAELRLGEAELLLAGLQGVVQSDQELARPQLEGLDVGCRGIQHLLLRAPATHGPGDQRGADARDHDAADDERHGGGGQRVREPVGVGDGAARPVVVAQGRGSSESAGDVGELVVGQREGVRDRDAVDRAPRSRWPAGCRGRPGRS